MTARIISLVAATVAIVALAGCDEVVDTTKPPPKQPEANQPERLFREIGAAELLERWSVLPNGAVAEPLANASGRRRAGATEGFSDLTHFRFRDAREYGACVVFAVDWDYGTGHIVDCVGGPGVGNTVEGLFHAAHMCDEPTRITIHLLRAGDFNPTTYIEERFANHPGDEYGFGVDAQVAGLADRFKWIKHWEYDDAEPVLVNWALLFHDVNRMTGKVDMRDVATNGFATLHRHHEDLHFSIDGSTGVVDVEPNDGAAWTEYVRRCSAL